MQESGQKIHTILGAPYEKRPWRQDSQLDSDRLEIRLDMELILSLQRMVVGHASELVEKGVLSAEEELFLKVGQLFLR